MAVGRILSQVLPLSTASSVFNLISFKSSNAMVTEMTVELSCDTPAWPIRVTNDARESLVLDCRISLVTLRLSTFTVSSKVSERTSEDRLRENCCSTGIEESSVYFVTGKAVTGSSSSPTISSTPSAVIVMYVLFSDVASPNLSLMEFRSELPMKTASTGSSVLLVLENG